MSIIPFSWSIFGRPLILPIINIKLYMILPLPPHCLESLAAHRHPWHLPPQRQLVAPFAEGQGVHLGVARPWSGGPGQLWLECPSTSNISIQASFMKDMSEAVRVFRLEAFRLVPYSGARQWGRLNIWYHSRRKQSHGSATSATNPSITISCSRALSIKFCSKIKCM